MTVFRKKKKNNHDDNMDSFNDSNKHKIISKIITTKVNCNKKNLTEKKI